MFDYIRRAMPPTAPGSLTDDQVYALTAFLLHANEIVAADAVMDKDSLPKVEMPAQKLLRARHPEADGGEAEAVAALYPRRARQAASTVASRSALSPAWSCAFRSALCVS
ncbi:MAG: hypothetical protein R2708_28750 [Vicinamibacterales bacterium]